jgi:hypothetical protein
MYGGEMENFGLANPSWPPRRFDSDHLTEEQIQIRGIDVFCVMDKERDLGYLFLRDLNEWEDRAKIERFRDKGEASPSVNLIHMESRSESTGTPQSDSIENSIQNQEALILSNCFHGDSAPSKEGNIYFF